MLKHRTLILIALLASSIAIPAGAQAATAAAPAPMATPSKPRIIRAPLAPPPINDVSRAYEFRTQLLGSPQCQRFATEADDVFLDGALNDEQKAARLKAIGEETRASDCLN